MPEIILDHLLRSLRRAAGRGAGDELTDGQLLERFIRQRDAAALEVLIWRHGPMVLGVCRRLLRQSSDVEDAFQATFLVFLRKARSIRTHKALGGWLYRVAVRTALRARAAAARRTALEQKTEARAPEPAANLTGPELRPVLDEEINRLPDRYRVPVVLCYLEGKTKEEAARLLGCPPGTVSSRLARARARLRPRLARRGLGLTSTALAALLIKTTASAMPPAHLVQATIKSGMLWIAGGSLAGTGIPASIATLTKGTLKAMVLAKVKTLAVSLLAVSLASLGAGLVLHPAIVSHVQAGQDEPVAAAPDEQPPKPPAETAPGKPAASSVSDHRQAKGWPSFPPAPGYSWAVGPNGIQPPGWFTSDKVLTIIDEDKNGALIVILSHPPAGSGIQAAQYRPVAFDADGKRFLLQSAISLLNTHVATARYRLDPAKLPASHVRYVGIEQQGGD
jgi:RNA polymerase sigma factor (sigma-70 family)